MTVESNKYCNARSLHGRRQKGESGVHAAREWSEGEGTGSFLPPLPHSPRAPRPRYNTPHEGLSLVLFAFCKQVCYRVLMQLCGQYGHPALAVKVSVQSKIGQMRT